MEYEVDVQRLIAGIVRRWPLILAGALLLALLGAGIALLQPQRYTATSSVLLLVRETSSQVRPGQDLLDVESIDVTARRDGLVTLARTAAIEAKLDPELVQRVTSAPYKPGMLVNDEYVRVVAAGDVMLIDATTTDPEHSRELADAWAQTFVEFVAPLYSDEHSEVRLAGTAVVPYEPASRGVISGAILAGVTGALLGVLIAAVLEFVRRPSRVPGRVDGDRVVSKPAPMR